MRGNDRFVECDTFAQLDTSNFIASHWRCRYAQLWDIEISMETGHMNYIRIPRMLFCIVYVVIAAAPEISDAEPILLTQLYHAQTQSASGQATFNFRFHTAESVQNQAEISRTPTPADIGQTFSTDPENLARFNEILTVTSRTILVDSYHGIASLPREAAVHEFFDGPFMDDFPATPIPESNQFIMKAFVPNLGPNLSGYRITDVRQTIDGMTTRQLNDNTFVYWAGHNSHLWRTNPGTCDLATRRDWLRNVFDTHEP